MNDSGDRPVGIVCLSGGMDSCVTAAIAVKESIPAFLHVSYGQRTENRERLAFDRIADFYRIPEQKRLHLRLNHLKIIGGSALTDPAIPVPKFDEIDEKSPSDSLPVTYVPFRNAHILSLAVSWAEVIKADRIYIGAVSEDSAGYPDCRSEYFEAFNRLIVVGSSLGAKLKVMTPLIQMTKSEIVRKGMELSAPFEFSWSCYEREDIACARCDSCLRRLRAFKESGFPDPLPYAADH
ncbi:7-cyano-7-deazaguanine synthase QueC [Candidatus Sumerlaeota bacterium]|nr:7-cyano-7-deazaguanine synthase QueC [Candidatus Sumerlaeota bacterium]